VAGALDPIKVAGSESADGSTASFSASYSATEDTPVGTVLPDGSVYGGTIYIGGHVGLSTGAGGGLSPGAASAAGGVVTAAGTAAASGGIAAPNTAVSFIPVIGSAWESIHDFSSGHYIMGTAYAAMAVLDVTGVGEVGDLALKGALQIGSRLGGRTIAETLPKGITQIKNASGEVFKEIHTPPSAPHAGMAFHTHPNYRNVTSSGIRTGVAKSANGLSRRDIIDAVRIGGQRTGGN
jgi:hypothetical protein